MPHMTLRELARRAGVSESALYTYLRSHRSRIPAVGRGRRRRYPESAIEVVRQIRSENLRRKQRRRDGYHTLKDISRITGISQTTLSRYLRLFGDQIPCQGEGRKRMYPPQAIRQFRKIRLRSRRGPEPGGRPSGAGRQPPAGSLMQRLQALEAQQRRTNRLLEKLLKELNRPQKIVLTASRKRI